MSENKGNLIQMPKISRLDSLDILRVIACLLITNSHCRNMYPVMFLAIGGGFGNALFFIISGFLLANVSLPFGTWYKKRVSRLVFPVVLFSIVNVFMGIVSPSVVGFTDGMGIVDYLLWYLDLFWFANAILIYYVPFYFIFHRPTEKKLLTGAVLWLTCYFLLYIFFVDKSAFNVETNGFVPIKVVFYFGVMVLGGFVRIISDKIRAAKEGQEKKFPVKMIAAAFFFAVLWAVIYALNLVMGKALSLQFLVQFAVMGFALFMIFAALSMDKLRLPDNGFGKVLSLVSAATLEIYLFQVTFLFAFEKIAFPLNLPVFFVGVFSAGTLVHMLIDRGMSRGKK